MDKILIVEDELLVSLVYEKYLSNYGFEFLGPFTTGEEAIKVIKDLGVNFSAALLDIQLDDEVSGLAVAVAIRQQSNIPIIFTTGNDLLKTEKEIASLKNVFVLSKPINMKKLLEILQTD